MSTKTNYEKNGVNYYRTTYTHGKDKNGKRQTFEFYAKSKTLAEKKKAEFVASIKQGLDYDYNKIYFGPFVKDWIYNVMLSSNLARSSKGRYEGIYRLYIQDSPLYNLKLIDISFKHLLDYYESLDKAGCSSSKIKNLNNVLKIVFGYAIEEGKILKNQAKSKRHIFNNKKKEREVEVFTSEEIRFLMKNIVGDPLEPIIAIGIFAGLRRGEITALKIGDVDLSNNLIKVERTLRKNRYISSDGSYYYKTETQPPKTRSSIRTVTIPTMVTEIIRKHLDLKKQNCGHELSSDDFIFTSTNGMPLDGRNLLRSYKRLLKRLSLKERPFHSTRHTFVSQLFSKGCSLKEIQMLCGHSSISTTSDIYLHLQPKQLHDAVAGLNELLKDEN